MPKIEIQIKPSGIDVFSHVNNPVYVNYFQQAFAENRPRLGLILIGNMSEDIICLLKASTSNTGIW
jgi:hypothetical protein